MFSYALNGLLTTTLSARTQAGFIKKEKDRLGIDGDTRRLVGGGSLT
jgi:hypothetical protein